MNETTLWIIEEEGEEDRIATNEAKAMEYAAQKPGRVVKMEKGYSKSVLTKCKERNGK